MASFAKLYALLVLVGVQRVRSIAIRNGNVYSIDLTVRRRPTKQRCNTRAFNPSEPTVFRQCAAAISYF